MQNAINKAKALIEAMEYIRQFKDKIVVIKLGGSILDDEVLQRELLRDVVFMHTVGIMPLLVHGGGKHISRAMETSGIEPEWVHGRRYTDRITLKIVEHTLINEVNKPLCDILTELGCDSMGLHSMSSCAVTGKPLVLREDGRKLDLGYVGEVESVNSRLLEKLCRAGTIPVLAPLGIDIAGQKLNINADSVAGVVASAVGAEKFVLLSDTHGIRENIDDPESRISSISEDEIKSLIDKGVIAGGMLPKIDSCLKAIDGGVGKAHIIDGRLQHSLLLEIYTEEGIGTQITK
ncbi:acetylglutamate kinase [Sedimentisphaera salicampi]|uniref:Acetylglutamate kinase n=1 Tax=Sedimentisphaera salicampi TaxID=1941349 RepID=A0A1W6LPN0_9BACT|nr:acetylglutamate kinase [Sedimentisphaera salicampi]ARN57739.1 Acetylglutamate kinase [Sedimentisphaera salicampi]OXU14297.1 Acetylglutamate kinase [Sedimentisphaera salicampi]